jgi:pimeloyl-ACP methyl ester carboxylesterase
MTATSACGTVDPLTEAQDPFFGSLDDNLPSYRAIATPTLMIVGGQDRAIPLWQQRKIYDLLPHARWGDAGSGHTAYIEKPKQFFGMIRAFMAAKSLDFDLELT